MDLNNMNYVSQQNNLVEIDTGIIVYSTTNKKKLVGLKNYLNSGGGFDGWSPEFLFQKLKSA